MLVARCQDIQEFKELHAKCENDRLPPAESILHNWDWHYCFYDEKTNKLLGCIYLEDDEGRVCLSGFSCRKNYHNIIDAIKWVSNYLRHDDLYAMTDKRNARIVLLRCGFKQLDDETLMRKAF